MLKLKQIVPPPVEPVTLEQVKTALKFDSSDDTPDDEIKKLLPAAREWCEKYQNRAYVQQMFELALDCWPQGNRIRLPRPPLQQIDSLTYTDANGGTVTWDASNYTPDQFAEPGYLVKARGVSWPSVGLSSNSIKIRYVAGYDPVVDDDEMDYTANISAIIKQAIILLVCYWYENGYCEPPSGIKSLLGLDWVVPL